MKIIQAKFDSGLALGPAAEMLADGYLRRNRGINYLSYGSFRSRFGSALIHSLAAHSIIYFAGNYHYGVGTALYRNASSIKTSLSGDKISFSSMPPTAGIPDYLFGAEDSDLFKVDSDGAVTNWGIDPPASAPTLTAVDLTYTSIRTAAYRWTQIGVTAEYGCELAATGDPSIPEPTFVREDSTLMPLGSAVGSLDAGEYFYGDGGPGFDAVIVRLSDDTDPDTKALDYIDYTDDSAYLTSGTYKYQITYYNSTTGHRSNGNGTDVEITLENQSVSITNIPDPTSIDTQISHVEIWRTVINGDALFLLDRVTAGTTTYTDDGTETLSSVELPVDNFKPLSTFFECLGPHNASMFWLSSASGAEGRIYYSPIGRVESYSGFINVCQTDAPLNKLFLFQSQLGVIGEGGIYIISGGNPYTSRQVSGCPGTTSPFTASIIPNVGLMYEASDGVRLFDGTTSTLITPGAIDRIFQSESVGDLTSFSGVISAFCRDEYIISDGSQSLGYNYVKKSWRDLGVGMNAIYYNQKLDAIAATISSTVLSFELETETDDNGTDIPISIEFPHLIFEDDRKRTLQHLTIDIDTDNEEITATLIHDSLETSLGVFQHTNRTKETIAIGIDANEFGLKLTGSLSTGRVELFNITYIINEL